MDEVEFPNDSISVKQEMVEEFGLPTDCLEVDINKTKTGINQKNGNTHVRKNRVYKSNTTCKICSKVFGDSWKLKRHENIHIKAGELPEPTEESEEGEDQLMEQKEEIAFKLNATCKICSKGFRDSWKLKRHEKVHIKTGELPEPIEKPEEGEEQPIKQIKEIKMEQIEEIKSSSDINQTSDNSDEKVNIKTIEVRNEENHKSELKQIKTMKNFHCRQCNKRFPDKFKLRRHEKVHLKRKLLKGIIDGQNLGEAYNNFLPCQWEGCNFSFETKGTLDQHIYILHKKATIGNKTKLKCVTCDLPFKSVCNAMWKHAKTCEMKETLCQHCGKVFISKYKQKIHERDCFEKKQPPKKCDICTKMFSTSKLLERHKRVVHGDKEHMCGMCGKAFSNTSNLKLHENLVHLKIRRFKCEQCEQTFQTNQGLKDHVLSIHSDERPLQCDKCDKTFKIQANLLKHTQNVHEKIKRHSCEICSKQFFLLTEMRKHVERIHEGKRDICLYCGLLFSNLRKGMYIICSISCQK